MALFCIPKLQAEQLRKAAKAGDFTIQSLQKKTSAQRREVFAKYIGETDAKEINALFEKAMVSSQKQAMKNWVWKNFYGGKPLYSEIAIADSQAMRNAGLAMKDLRKMTSEKRISTLQGFVGLQKAEKLNARFERLQKTGNLSNWEERVLGTNRMLEDRKLKGAFSRLEVMDDLGILNPTQMDEFMEDLVALRLGVDISPTEAAQISRLTNQVSEAFDAVENNWTFFNEEKVMAYFNARRSLEEFIEKTTPAPLLKVFTDVSARGALLYSLRSINNSFAFQIVPFFTRAIVKRIVTIALLPGDFTKLEQLQNIMSSSILSKGERDFVAKQTKMGVKIYKQTGYDISRLQNLDDGFHFFGEKFTHVNGPTLKEAKTIQEYLGGGVRAHAKFMQGGLKWAAGGTDMLFGNIHRADTTALLAKITAKHEAKHGKLPKGMTVEARTRELLIEASSFNPQSEQAQYIRHMGIQDAHRANGTQNEIYGETALKMRDSLDIKNVSLGKLLIPFLKIPANMLGTGVEATGPGLILGMQQTVKGITSTARGVDKSIEVAEGLSKMLTSAGLLGSAVFLSSLFDPDDFIGAYDWKARSENKFTQTKNAGSNYVRIGGKWYSTRWLGPLQIPFTAMMYSRQAKAKGENALAGYFSGVMSGIAEFPGLKELSDIKDKIIRAAESSDLQQIAKIFGLDWDSTSKWMSSRMLPSFVTYDILGIFSKTRYDAFGRAIPKRGDSVKQTVLMAFTGANIKQDTSNAITKEFDRLLLSGNLPVLTDPSRVRETQAIEKYGEEGYISRLNTLKKDYAEAVEALLQSRRYKRLSDEEKKKEINGVRQREIINRL